MFPPTNSLREHASTLLLHSFLAALSSSAARIELTAESLSGVSGKADFEARSSLMVVARTDAQRHIHGFLGLHPPDVQRIIIDHAYAILFGTPQDVINAFKKHQGHSAEQSPPPYVLRQQMRAVREAVFRFASADTEDAIQYAVVSYRTYQHTLEDLTAMQQDAAESRAVDGADPKAIPFDLSDLLKRPDPDPDPE